MTFNRQHFISSRDGGAFALDWYLHDTYLNPATPIFLFIQGFGKDGNVHLGHNRRLIPVVGEMYRVICVLPRGCGDVKMTSKIPLEETCYLAVHDIAEAVEKIGELFPEAPIHMVGFSLGGTLAALYCATFRDEHSCIIESLLTVCSPTSADELVCQDKRRDSLSHAIGGLLSDNYRDFLVQNNISLPGTFEGTNQLLNSLQFRLRHFIKTSFKEDRVEVSKTNGETRSPTTVDDFPFERIDVPAIFLVAEDDPVVSCNGWYTVSLFACLLINVTLS